MPRRAELSLDGFIKELKNNPRLGVGVVAIAVLLCFYGVLVLKDMAAQEARAYADLTARVARMEAAAKDTVWLRRAEETTATLLEMESQMWRAPTQGLAQASFQDWLNQMAQQSKIANASITVVAQDDLGARQDGATGAEAFWKVGARISFDFSPQVFYALLAGVIGHDRRIVVEALTIRGAPQPKAELQLAAYFEKPSAISAEQPPASR